MKIAQGIAMRSGSPARAVFACWGEQRATPWVSVPTKIARPVGSREKFKTSNFGARREID